jgi:hypothetical protein
MTTIPIGLVRVEPKTNFMYSSIVGDNDKTPFDIVVQDSAGQLVGI